MDGTLIFQTLRATRKLHKLLLQLNHTVWIKPISQKGSYQGQQCKQIHRAECISQIREYFVYTWDEAYRRCDVSST